MDDTRFAMSKTSLYFGFFCHVNQNLKSWCLRIMVCDFDPFNVFLSFKVRCFRTSEFGCFHFLALNFFFTAH